MALYAGSYKDLAILDFSFLNLQFANINSQSFIKFLSKHCEKDYLITHKQTFEDFKKKEPFGEIMYALYPIDINKEVDEELFWKVLDCILVMSPSHFRIYAICNYSYDGKNMYNPAIASYEVHSYLNQFEFMFPTNTTSYLSLQANSLKTYNYFIKLYFKRVQNLKYLGVMIFSYRDSFHQTNLYMSFLSLCICLEALIEGTSELNYRIRRACAIINGDNIKASRIIFDNVKLIYNLRSKIVHGSEPNLDKVIEYYPTLRALVSKTITELIIFNSPSISELNKKITELGFGDKLKLSPNSYEELNLDIISKAKIVLSLDKR